MPDSIRDFFDALAKVLLRCWIFGIVVLVVWFGFFLLLNDVIYTAHGPMFDLSNHELNVIHYCGMGIWKLFVIVFNFFPWLAIRMVLKNQQTG